MTFHYYVMHNAMTTSILRNADRAVQSIAKVHDIVCGATWIPHRCIHNWLCVYREISGPYSRDLWRQISVKSQRSFVTKDAFHELGRNFRLWGRNFKNRNFKAYKVRIFSLACILIWITPPIDQSQLTAPSQGRGLPKIKHMYWKLHEFHKTA